MALAPWRYLAELSRGWFGHPFSPLIYMPLAKRMSASSDLFLRITERYEKPQWNIPDAVPEVVDAEPFCNLVHFRQKHSKPRKVLEDACRLGAYVASHYGATPLLPAELTQPLR